MLLCSTGCLSTFLPWVEWSRSNVPPQRNDRQLPPGFRNRNYVIWFHISGPIGLECGDARGWFFFRRMTLFFFFTGSKLAIDLTFIQTNVCVIRNFLNFVLVTYCSKMFQNKRYRFLLHNSCVIYYHIALMNSKTKVGMQAEIILSAIIISHFFLFFLFYLAVIEYRDVEITYSISYGIVHVCYTYSITLHRRNIWINIFPKRMSVKQCEKCIS